MLLLKNAPVLFCTLLVRHCEKQSDEAIYVHLLRGKHISQIIKLEGKLVIIKKNKKNKIRSIFKVKLYYLSIF